MMTPQDLLKLRACIRAAPRKRYGGTIVLGLIDEIERLQAENGSERKHLQRDLESERKLRRHWERDHLRIAKKCDALELALSDRALPGSKLPVIDVVEASAHAITRGK